MLEDVHRAEWARLVAALTRRFGSLDVAEEAAADAFALAVQHWREELPPNPGGWLMTTATRRAIDRLRRERRRQDKYTQLARDAEVIHVDPDLGSDSDSALGDDRLGLIFTCCHPALSRDAQLALTLRMVGGLDVGQIARGLLVSEAAIGQRITRAKAKIAAAQIPFAIPSAEELPARVDNVLTVLYLIFNEGYLPGGEEPLAPSLTREALALTRLLVALLPGDGEAVGLLALMLMTEARRASRISGDGELVVLAEQDRGGWDRELILEGHRLVRTQLSAPVAPGRYGLQAAINAVHTYARDVRETDWAQLDILYAQLATVDPSPVVALNRAVVRAELDGPEAALTVVDSLELTDYHPYHATRAELLRRLGRSAEASDAYAAAIALAVNPAERRFLQRRRDSLASP